MKKYNRGEVLILLEEQRELCASQAQIKTYTVNSPYSDNDGNITYTIDKNSILNAKLEEQDITNPNTKI